VASTNYGLISLRTRTNPGKSEETFLSYQLLNFRPFHRLINYFTSLPWTVKISDNKNINTYDIKELLAVPGSDFYLASYTYLGIVCRLSFDYRPGHHACTQ
jgi:hypothetical protein